MKNSPMNLVRFGRRMTAKLTMRAGIALLAAAASATLAVLAMANPGSNANTSHNSIKAPNVVAETPKAPSQASPTALINGLTVSGGASSQEAMGATALGYVVTVVSDAAWQAMTQAQFGAYDLLIIGDPTCSSTSQNAAANAAVWAPVVMGTAGGRTAPGNRVFIGTDPVFHDSGIASERATIIRDGLKFAGKQPGRTGLYFCGSCSGGSGNVLAALTLLSTGSGVWTANDAPPCGGSVSLIASEPSFGPPDPLTTASLQGWSCSVHESFPTFPTDWNALAVATDTPTTPTCGVDPNTGLSACGQAYILIAGSSIIVGSGSISVAPLDATNPVNTDHTVTAHATSGGSPLANQIITWTVTGVNAGASGTCVPAGCTTDSNGDVSFTYHDTNGLGDDTIKASFTDAAGSLQSATAQKHWVTSSGCPEGMCCVCHKGLTLSLACTSLEYRRHIDHGDTIGVCESTGGRR